MRLLRPRKVCIPRSREKGQLMKQEEMMNHNCCGDHLEINENIKSLCCVKEIIQCYTSSILQRQTHRKRDQICGYRGKWVRIWMKVGQRYKFSPYVMLPNKF